MKHTFISYASNDLPMVEKICAHLERRGIDCWMAPRDIIPGKDYAAEIIGGIEGAATTLLLLSEHSNQSMFVKREIERAVSKAKPVIPVRIQSVMPSASLELFVSSSHWIDVWQEPMDPKMDLLATAIRKLSGENFQKTEELGAADAGELRPSRGFAVIPDASSAIPSGGQKYEEAMREDAIVGQPNDQRQHNKGGSLMTLKWSIGVVAGFTMLVVGYAFLNHVPERTNRVSDPTLADMPTEATHSDASLIINIPPQFADKTSAPDRIDDGPSNDSARMTGTSRTESGPAVVTRKTAKPDKQAVAVAGAEGANAVHGKAPSTQAARPDAQCMLILGKASLGAEPLTPDESNYLQSHCR